MKIAIVGSGSLALLAAKHFDDLGAYTVLFQRSPLGGNIRLLADQLPDLEIKYKGRPTTVKKFVQSELIELVNQIEAKEISRKGDVLRVHKRFLHKGERINGKSRLHDLFRVVYSLNPQESILKQVEENPEVFNKLGKDVLESLHKPVESFEDFDIVIEATGLGKKARPMGAGGDLALNENNLQSSGLIAYGSQFFPLENKKNIVLVGEAREGKVAAYKLRDWLLSKPENRIHWVTSDHLALEHHDWLDNQIQQLFKSVDENFEKDKQDFEKKMHAWRDLEDYERVKVPRPIEPQPKILFYEGYDVTSVDRLLDKEGVFATIESPDFRHVISEENLATLAADMIWVTRGVQHNDTLGRHLENEEPGYYRLTAPDLDSGMAQIRDIESNLMTYFKKA
jgi:hypothetical protein